MGVEVLRVHPPPGGSVGQRRSTEPCRPLLAALPQSARDLDAVFALVPAWFDGSAAVVATTHRRQWATRTIAAQFGTEPALTHRHEQGLAFLALQNEERRRLGEPDATGSGCARGLTPSVLVTVLASLAVALTPAVLALAPLPLEVVRLAGRSAWQMALECTISTVARAVAWPEVPSPVVSMVEVPRFAGLNGLAAARAINAARIDQRLPLLPHASVLVAIPAL